MQIRHSVDHILVGMDPVLARRVVEEMVKAEWADKVIGDCDTPEDARAAMGAVLSEILISIGWNAAKLAGLEIRVAMVEDMPGAFPPIEELGAPPEVTV